MSSGAPWGVELTRSAQRDLRRLDLDAPVRARVADSLRALAEKRGVTPAQLATAWVLSRGADIFPLIGARTRAQLRESLGALELSLSSKEMDQVARAVPAEQVAGTRYAPAQMAMLDSERPGC